MKIAVIGNSAAALSAIEAFRKHDRTSDIVVVSREKHPAYSRVLLPYFLQGRIGRDQLFFPAGRFAGGAKVRTFLGRSVEEVDLFRKWLFLDNGEKIPFDKLLIASGSSPVKPRIPGWDDRYIHHLWTIEDAVRIGRLLKGEKELLLIGGGAISLMVAWIAVQKKMKVTVVERLPRLMPQVLDAKGAEIVEAAIRKAGVRVLTRTTVERIERRPEGRFRVHPACGRSFRADVIIVAVGVRPNVGFIDGDRVSADQGILVDHRMRTSFPDVYAAGDVAQGPTAYGARPRVDALWSTAVEHGAVAGANMAGKETHYPGCLGGNVCEFFGLTSAPWARSRNPRP
jgi:NADPH-dependent 2,4-dienoyl-CoA reductase/sulfur reductase-like enzyme